MARLHLLVLSTLLMNVVAFSPVVPPVPRLLQQQMQERKEQWRQKQVNQWRKTKSSVALRMNINDDPLIRGAVTAGFVAQPVVWISLFCVATTGGGLPAGPFGLLGALEGVSYLIILGFCGTAAYRNVTTKSGKVSTVETLSSATLFAGLLVLFSLVLDQGCVPNAKPLLDYSNYLPVCDATPDLFGG